MPATVSKRPSTVSAWHLISCTPIQSAPTPSAQASKPFAAAERMPFRFSETRRNKAIPPCPSTPPDPTLAREFVAFAVEAGVLRFGEFRTKAGRLSPYFFNAGLFDDGAKLVRLSEFYARRLLASGLEFDMLFGPAYKGITLAAAVAIAVRPARPQRCPSAYNRKEAKDHGEGGIVVGAPLRGRTVIVDDVITDGASKRESVELIRREGATPVAVLIALDRMERGGTDDNLSRHSAVMDFERDLGLPVIAIATLADLMEFLQLGCEFAARGARRGGGETIANAMGLSSLSPAPRHRGHPGCGRALRPCLRCRRPGRRAGEPAHLPVRRCRTAASSPPTGRSPNA